MLQCQYLCYGSVVVEELVQIAPDGLDEEHFGDREKAQIAVEEKWETIVFAALEVVGCLEIVPSAWLGVLAELLLMHSLVAVGVVSDY